MLRWIFASLVASSCLATPAPKPLPQAPRNLNTCLLGAVQRRAACGGASACERDVSEGWAHRCYAHLYRVHTDDSDVSMTTLGPCFWDDSTADGDNAEATRLAYKETVIEQTCDGLELQNPLKAHCQAELRFAIDDLCMRGDVWLSGAGP